MKKILLAFLLVVFNCGFPQVNWMTMNQALDAQKKNPKKILVEFYANWCGPCKDMEKYTFGNPDIAKYINENYYAVKFDAEGGEQVNIHGQVLGNPTYNPNEKIKYGGNGSRNQFSQVMGVRAYPTLVFFDEKALPITNITGYMPPKQLEPYLVVVFTDEYQKIKTQEDWENYIKNFKYQVK